MRDFVAKMEGLIAHIHLVDAEGLDCGGLQIGDGGIDFANLLASFDQHATGAWF